MENQEGLSQEVRVRLRPGGRDQSSRQRECENKGRHFTPSKGTTRQEERVKQNLYATKKQSIKIHKQIIENPRGLLKTTVLRN